MELSTKQKNELLTGIILAQELTALTDDTRRFITVKSYDISDNRIKPWTGNIPASFDNLKAQFMVRVYSIKSEYIELDADERDCSEHILLSEIYSFEELYEILKKYISDFSGLVPQWNVDNPIE